MIPSIKLKDVKPEIALLLLTKRKPTSKGQRSVIGLVLPTLGHTTDEGASAANTVDNKAQGSVASTPP